MKRNCKMFCSVLMLIFLIGIGFAVLTTNLNINFGLAFKTNTWDVHLEKLEVIDTTLKTGTSNILNSGISINFGGNFEKPGDYYEYSVYVVNDGTVDAIVDEIKTTGLTDDIKDYFNYNVSYYDGTDINKDDILRAGSVKKIKVRLEYKYDIEEFISIDELNLILTVKYVQLRTNTSNIWTYEYIDKAQTFYVPKTGNYKIELWGAQGGGNSIYTGGLGGYTSGNIELQKNNKLYIYVGEGATDKTDIRVFNNGSLTSSHLGYRYAGGGSTDVRLSSGTWSDFSSLKSRIMVAAGGGGAIVYAIYYSGAAAGGLVGYDGLYGIHGDGQAATGGTQTGGGHNGMGSIAKYSSEYAFFGNITNPDVNEPARKAGSGGNGYYGGGSGAHGDSTVGSGAGGSSFISGHNGCVAITEDSTENNINQRTGTNDSVCSDGTTDIQCSYHYSNKIFTNTVMIDGKGYNWTTEVGDEVVGMPTHDGTGTMIGNVGDGYVKITLIS